MNDSSAPGPREFTTTHWSLVAAAKSDEASRTRARLALEELCKAYWYPLYAFVRYRGYSSDDAKDLTQAFFTRIIETRGIAFANPERVKWIEQKIKLGRVGEIEDIMGAAVFLASDPSALVTGTSILVDGGWTAG